jgi:hypothetical protein
MFTISVIFSIFKLFEFKTNEIYSSFDKNFPYNAYDIKYCETYAFKNIYSFWIKCNLFWTFDLVNTGVKSSCVLLISLIVDILMIRFSNAIVAKKRAINCPHLSEAIKYKANLNKMILVNGCLIFVSHMPEFVVTLLLMIFKRNLSEFCHQFFSCSELIEMARVFHLLSIGLNFFIFKHFDHNFSKK